MELKDRYGEGYGKVGKCIDWLKSLRPQYSNVERNGKNWKPTEEQMDALEDAIREGDLDNLGILSLLYNDLKALL